MQPLRWLLGISSGLGALGWILIAIAANDFRRSFGASPVGFARVAILRSVVGVIRPAGIFRPGI